MSAPIIPITSSRLYQKREEADWRDLLSGLRPRDLEIVRHYVHELSAGGERAEVATAEIAALVAVRS